MSAESPAPSDAADELRDWQKILYHEAAHAATSIELVHEAAPIVVRCWLRPDGQQQRGGTFRKRIGVAFGTAEPDALDLVLVIAAGAMAEEDKFGEVSQGFENDRVQIDNLLGIRQDKKALAERDTGFPETRKLIQRLANVIEHIANAALQSLEQQALLGKVFEHTELLSAVEVQQLYDQARRQLP